MALHGGFKLPWNVHCKNKYSVWGIWSAELSFKVSLKRCITANYSFWAYCDKNSLRAWPSKVKIRSWYELGILTQKTYGLPLPIKYAVRSQKIQRRYLPRFWDSFFADCGGYRSHSLQDYLQNDWHSYLSAWSHEKCAKRDWHPGATPRASENRVASPSIYERTL